MLDRDDIPQLRDIPAALGLLSRLPISVDFDHATARGARAAWAYPVVGLILGIIACTIGQIALWLGVPNTIAAGLIIATLTITTGAMHEDGLADSADGLWGGWDKDHRLKIMKDSFIGTYGVTALVLGFALRWQALTYIIDAQFFWPAILVTAMLSRALMVALMSVVAHARTEGLSHRVGRPSVTTALIGLSCAVTGLVVFNSLLLIIPALLAALVCATIAKSKIGGQTGDILGATQQITELTILLTLAALLT